MRSTFDSKLWAVWSTLCEFFVSGALGEWIPYRICDSASGYVCPRERAIAEGARHAKVAGDWPEL